MIKHYDSILPAARVCQRLEVVAQVWRTWSPERHAYFAKSGKIACSLLDALDRSAALLATRFNTLWRDYATTLFVTPFALDIVLQAACIHDAATLNGDQCMQNIEQDILRRLQHYRSFCSPDQSLLTDCDAVCFHFERLLQFMECLRARRRQSKPRYGMIYSAMSDDCLAFVDNQIDNVRWFNRSGGGESTSSALDGKDPMPSDAIPAQNDRLAQSLQAATFVPLRDRCPSPPANFDSNAGSKVDALLVSPVVQTSLPSVDHLVTALLCKSTVVATLLANASAVNPKRRGRVVMVTSRDNSVKQTFWQPLSSICLHQIDPVVLRCIKAHDARHFVLTTILDDQHSAADTTPPSRAGKCVRKHSFIFKTSMLDRSIKL